MSEQTKAWRFGNKEKEAAVMDLMKKGLYTISKEGVVFNNTTKRFIGTVIKSGYVYANMLDPNTCKKYGMRVHRLVWLFYKGDIPYGLEINHKDGNKANNNLENLELVTSSENQQHAIKNGLSNFCEGPDSGVSKLTYRQALEARQLYSTGNYSMAKLAKIFELKDKKTMRHIIRGKSYKNVPMVEYPIKNINWWKKTYTKEEEQKIINLRKEQHLSIPKISEKFNKKISKKTITKILKRHNI